MSDVADIPLEGDEAFDCALAAARAVPGLSVRNADRARRLIKATVSISWDSHGERVAVRLKSAAPGRTTVSVQSKPKLPTTLFDGGKNRDNVDRIVAALHACELDS